MALCSRRLVTDRKDGVMAYYRLGDPRVRDLIAMTLDLLLKTDVEGAKRPPSLQAG